MTWNCTRWSLKLVWLEAICAELSLSKVSPFWAYKLLKALVTNMFCKCFKYKIIQMIIKMCINHSRGSLEWKHCLRVEYLEKVKGTDYAASCILFGGKKLQRLVQIVLCWFCSVLQKTEVAHLYLNIKLPAVHFSILTFSYWPELATQCII